MRRYSFTLCLLLLAIAVYVRPAVRAEELRKASLRLQWAPQAQFAGYYVAAAKGFYREAGIEMTIRPGGPRIASLNSVVSGRDTFGTEWLVSGMAFAGKGAPVVNIAQMLQTSGLMLITLKKSGIDTVAKMEGRTVGVWPGMFSLAPNLLFEQHGVRPQRTTQGFNLEDFLSGSLEVASAMIYNEYHSILSAGVTPEQLNLFHFRDHGLNFPEDGLYASVDTVTKDPKLCLDVVGASVRGWLYAFDHPQEAVDIVMLAAEEAKTGTDRAHQQRMLEEIQQLMLYRVGRDGIGELCREDFDFVAKVMEQNGLLPRDVTYNGYYRPHVPGLTVHTQQAP